MTDLKKINAECYDVFTFHYGACDRLYAPTLYMCETERIKNLKKKLDSTILEIIEKYPLGRKDEELYYIQLYAIHFLEGYLDQKQFEEIIDAILSISKEPNFLSPLVLVLMSHGSLSEDTIRKIYLQCEIQLLSEFPRLGKKPYDYRYHLLKRDETPEDIKNKIFSSYDEYSQEELRDFMTEILNELNSELYRYQIKDLDEVDKFPDLKMEYHYFEVMKNYYGNRLKKEKMV